MSLEELLFVAITLSEPGHFGATAITKTHPDSNTEQKTELWAHFLGIDQGSLWIYNPFLRNNNPPLSVFLVLSISGRLKTSLMKSSCFLYLLGPWLVFNSNFSLGFS